MTESPRAEHARARRILRRTAFGTAIAAAVAFLFVLGGHLGPRVPLAVALALGLACAAEVGQMGSLSDRGLAYALAGVAMAFAIAGADSDFYETARYAYLRSAVAAAVAAPAIQAVGRRRIEGRQALVAAGLALWILPPLAVLPYLWSEWGGRDLLALIALSKVGDMAGYFVGNAFGRRHPFPRLSPGKTTEGCLGSLLGGALLGLVLGMAEVVSGGPLYGLLVGAVLNVAAQAGDLLESKVKRLVGVKDSSGWLGASGGFLDVLDSLFLTVPAAVLLWPGGL